MTHCAQKENGLPCRIYTLDELSQMCESGRLVVAYQGSLYDVTKFTGHPGGVGRLQMAAGSDLEVRDKSNTNVCCAEKAK